MWRRVVTLLVPGLLVAGCAASTPMPRPAELPFHAAAPPLDFYWQISLSPSVARADGLIERHDQHIGSAWPQLIGLDETGRIVSFTTPARVRWRSASDLESFTLSLRLQGREQRFEVRLYSFEYQEEMSP